MKIKAEQISVRELIELAKEHKLSALEWGRCLEQFKETGETTIPPKERPPAIAISGQTRIHQLSDFISRLRQDEQGVVICKHHDFGLIERVFNGCNVRVIR